MKKKRRLKKSAKIVLSILLVIIILLIVLLTNSLLNKNNKKVEVVESTPTATTTPVVEELEYKVDFNEQKAINGDYVGHLYFESGLVDQLVVQCDDNEYYLDKDFNQQYNSHGTVFMDYRNRLDDQNIILYGHYVYADETLMFSPLHDLKEESNYEKDSILYFELEDEIRTYQVAYVYYYVMNSQDLMYYYTNYDQDYFNTYIENVKANQFYSSSIDIDYNDHFLTLQTCVRNRDDLRLIIVAKQIDN